MPRSERVYCVIPSDYAGQRLDQALAALLPAYSRSRLQQWLKDGRLQVNGRVRRPRDQVWGGETVSGEWRQEDETVAKPQNIPLDIRFEDEDLLVICKPAGLVVHPAAGNPEGTLLNALLHHAPELAELPRAGLIHRLDKDTSGLLVVARSWRAQAALAAQLQHRTMGREYEAVADGVITTGGSVNAPVRRHAVDRQRMAVAPGGKPAVTHYLILRRFRTHTHLRVKLETGRTHQIRVHMAHIGHPLAGDPVYGHRPRLPPQAATRCREVIQGFRRQALHAAYLSCCHPADGTLMEWRAEPPADLAELLAVLTEDADTAHD